MVCTPYSTSWFFVSYLSNSWNLPNNDWPNAYVSIIREGPVNPVAVKNINSEKVLGLFLMPFSLMVYEWLIL